MSEFGSGVVVPLVKFSEHIGDSFARRVERQIKWMQSSPAEREKIMKEAKDDAEWSEVLVLDAGHKSSEACLDNLITIWASGASYHLSHIDKRKAPKSLLLLTDLMFELRWPDEYGNLRDEYDWLRILSLWSEVAMDIDEMLGVTPDWGTW